MSDSESSREEGHTSETPLLDDENVRAPASTKASFKPSRHSVSNTAAALAGLKPSPTPSSASLPDDVADEVDGLEENDDDIDNPPDTALASITAAVTRRNLALSAARHVDPTASTKPPTAPTSADTPSHPDMVARILETLRPAHDGVPAATPSLPTLQKKVARLRASGKAELSVPLPAPVSARIQREAAYSHAKQELTDKWFRTVSRHRKDDRLVFPLHEPTIKHSTADLVARPPSREATAAEHEKEIDAILKSAGMSSDKTVLKEEQQAVENALSLGKVSKKEVIQRQRELARVRSIAFHYDQKMKRIKKIKSKKFRKILKREREKLEDAATSADPNAKLEEAVAAERRRIEERVTQRHKNTSKWVRRQLQRGEAKHDPDTRAAIEEQLRLHDELKRRQHGEVGEDGSDGEGSVVDSEGNEISEAEQLAEIEKELVENKGGVAGEGETKGIMSLRFMKAAGQRKRSEALKLIKEIHDEKNGVFEDEEDEQATVGRRTFSGTKEISLQKKKKKTRNEDTEEEVENFGGEGNGDGDGSEDEIEKLESRVAEEYDEATEHGLLGDKSNGVIDIENAVDVIRSARKSKNTFSTRLRKRLTADDNPWLSGSVSEKETLISKKKERAGDSVSVPSKPDDSGKKLTGGHQPKKKRKERKKGTKSSTGDEVNPMTGSEARMNGQDRKSKKRRNSGKQENGEQQDGQKVKKSKREDTRNEDSDSSDCNEDGKGDGALSKGMKENEASSISKVTTAEDENSDVDGPSQIAMIAEAFAGAGGADLADFEKAKQAEIEESLPTAKSLNAEVLPGWGQWDGAGMSKKEKERNKESWFARAARERLEAARKDAVLSRSDRNARNVILDQRRLRSATKVTISSVPYPFQSREQWQRELNRPLSRELVSNKAFREGVERRVQAPAGKIINPIDNPVHMGGGNADSDQLVQRGKGKKGVINLRKEKSTHRVKGRRGFLS